MRPGNTVYLPGGTRGTFLHRGPPSLRARGELCSVALEITSRVTVSFEIIKSGGIEGLASNPKIG